MTNAMKKMGLAIVLAASGSAAQAAAPEWLAEYPVQVTCHGHHPRVVDEGTLAVGVDLKAGKLRYALETGAGEPVGGVIGPVAGISSSAEVKISSHGARSIFRGPALITISGDETQVFRATRTETFKLDLDPAEEGESYVVDRFTYGSGFGTTPWEVPVTTVTPPIGGWACEVQGL